MKKKNFMGELQGYVIGSAVLVIAIVLVNLILTGVKPLGCTSLLYTFNTTSEVCYLTSNASQPTVTNPLVTNINTGLTALNTPITYIGLVILVVIFVFLLKLFTKKLSGRESE